MTIQEAQQTVDDWIKENRFRYFNELTNMAILTEEVGEVARIIARKYGEQSFKNEEGEMDLANQTITEISLLKIFFYSCDFLPFPANNMKTIKNAQY